MAQAGAAENGYLSLEDFETALDAASLQLVRHQAITIYRNLPKNEQGRASAQAFLQTIVGMAQ